MLNYENADEIDVQLTMTKQKKNLWMASAQETAPIMMGCFSYQGMYPYKTMKTPGTS